MCKLCAHGECQAGGRGLNFDKMPVGLSVPASLPDDTSWQLDEMLHESVDGCIGVQVHHAVDLGGSNNEMAARVSGATIFADLEEQSTEWMRYITGNSPRSKGEERLETRLLAWLRERVPTSARFQKPRLFIELQQLWEAKAAAAVVATKAAGKKNKKRKRGKGTEEQEDNEDDMPYYRGQKVKAHWLTGSGRGKVCPKSPGLYDGTVQGRGELVGTCEIHFDDGTKHSRVSYRHIRPR